MRLARLIQTHLCLLGAVLAFSGCTTTLGARTVAPTGFSYNTAIAHSIDEQLLLNLVRLRYRDTAVFMEIDHVTTQRQYAGNLSATSIFPFSGLTNGNSGFGAQASYSEVPTIRYTPLQGEKFAQNLLTPIPPETVILLSTSGWSLERLLLCCVEQLGALSNAPGASGPTPARFPDNSSFRQATQILRELQRDEAFHVELVKTENQGTDAFLVFDDPADPQLTRLLSLLGADPGKTRLRLVSRSHAPQDNDLLMIGRSILGSLYTLSHAVEAPETHEATGLVTLARDATGAAPDWRVFLNDLFKVHSSKSEPQTAFVKIFYRNHWFWIADNDLDSKTSFNLLVFLLALQSADGASPDPLLTISAGG